MPYIYIFLFGAYFSPSMYIYFVWSKRLVEKPKKSKTLHSFVTKMVSKLLSCSYSLSHSFQFLVTNKKSLNCHNFCNTSPLWSQLEVRAGKDLFTAGGQSRERPPHSWRSEQGKTSSQLEVRAGIGLLTVSSLPSSLCRFHHSLHQACFFLFLFLL